MVKVVERVRSRDEVIAEEDLVIDVQFLIQELIEDKGVSRTELAERVGISKARLSQLLGTDANPTLRNVARILHGLDERLAVAVKPRKARDQPRKASSPQSEPSFTYEAPSHAPKVETGSTADRAYLAIEGSFARTGSSWAVQVPSNDSYRMIEDQDFELAVA